MGSLGTAGKDAVTWGAAGAATGNPYIAGAAALAGGAYGLFSPDGSGPPTPSADPSNFRLGQGNGSNYTNQIAGMLANRGNAADAQGSLLGQQAQGAYGVAANAQSTGAPQIQQSANDYQRQIAALGGTNAQAGQLSGAAGQLQQLGTNGLPMGLAAAQLQQGENANMNQSLALAHSGRSLGSGAAALQNAQFQNAQTGQITNQQAAQANIAEQQQNQQFKLGALGAAQSGYGAAGSLYGQAGNQAAGINQTDLGVQQTNAGLIQGQQGINNQTSSTFGQLGQGLNASALGQQQLGQGYQQMGLGALGQQLNANQNLSSQSLGQGNIGVNNQIAQNTQNQATLSSLGQGVANYVAQNSGSAGSGGANGGGYAPGGAYDAGKNVRSDVNAKTQIKSLEPGGILLRPGMPAPMRQAGTGNMLAALGGAPMAPPASLVGSRAFAPPPNLGNAHLVPNDPNAMPSGAPTFAQMPGAAASQGYLSQLAGVGATAGSGPVGAPAHGDPYLASLAGTGSMYSPGGYHDPKLAAWQQGQADAKLAAEQAQAKALYDQYASQHPSYGQASVFVTSDAHSKAKIQSLEAQLAALSPPQGFTPQAPDTGSLDAAYQQQGGQPVAPPAVDLRPAQAYSYEYKNPAAHGQGTFVGPMAQDLEKTPAGASVVKQGPDGYKHVDTSRLSLVNTSAISEQQRKLQELQAQVAALSQPQMDAIQRGFPTQYPQTQAPAWQGPQPHTDPLESRF